MVAKPLQRFPMVVAELAKKFDPEQLKSVAESIPKMSQECAENMKALRNRLDR